MQSYYIKPKAFYDSFGDVQPSQPYSYTYGDRPVFEFSFLPNEIAEGDTLVFAIDNDMVFYDSAPENLLHSASCMVVVRHGVTAEEATAGKVQMRIETRTVKFRDVTNGKVRPVEVISGLYRRRGSDNDINYVLLAMGRAFANGIVADYNALPEPITDDEYYTKDETDSLLDAKADKADLVAHTDDTTIHVTQQEKTEWSNKADRNDIGNATVTITKDGETKGSFSVNTSENVTIDLTGSAQADWDETDMSSPSYIQHKPSVYTKTETDGMLDAKADKSTSIAGYGITDAYTKTEVDAKVSSVYHYKGTVSAYADLPASGQEIGDVYNVETADSTHGIKAGDNVAWTGTEWDVLAGEIDLSAYATKTELETKMDAPATGTVGQVLTKTADGQEWADAPAGGGGEDTTDYLCFTAEQANSTVRLDKYGTPPEISLEYSTDRKTWTEYTWNGNTGAPITLANIGDSVWWRGNNNTFSINSGGYHGFVMSGKIKASGNIMSLLDKTCESKELKTNLTRIFFNCTSLTTAPELPATTLRVQCYEWMFYGCKSLTKAPELPATTLASYCYDGMFYNCSSLTEAPVLKSTQLVSNCYKTMFRNCQRLKKVVALFEADSWGGGNCEMWLSGISTDGVFVCSPYLYGIPNSGDWGIPPTWKKETIYSPTTKKAVESTSSSITIYENNSKVDKITVSNSLTINAGHYVTNNLIAYAEIVLDVATGATVTAGTNMTLVDTPTAGKRNICVCRWSGGVCKLYVTIVEDLPA